MLIRSLFARQNPFSASGISSFAHPAQLELSDAKRLPEIKEIKIEVDTPSEEEMRLQNIICSLQRFQDQLFQNNIYITASRKDLYLSCAGLMASAAIFLTSFFLLLPVLKKEKDMTEMTVAILANLLWLSAVGFFTFCNNTYNNYRQYRADIENAPNNNLQPNMLELYQQYEIPIDASNYNILKFFNRKLKIAQKERCQRNAYLQFSKTQPHIFFNSAGPFPSLIFEYLGIKEKPLAPENNHHVIDIHHSNIEEKNDRSDSLSIN